MKKKILCHSEDYRYVKEYVDTFKGDTEVVVYSSEPILEYATYYMCVRRIPLGLSGKNFGFVNTEQLSVPGKLQEYSDILAAHRPTDIYDYSQANIAISGKGSYLPYISPPEEVVKLRGFLHEQKEFDVCVLGTASASRLQYVECLRNSGFTVDYVNSLFGDERDMRIAKSRILLNVHYSGEYALYESIRCERWRMAGMYILSEKCSDAILPEDIVFCSLETVVEEVRKILR